MYRDRKALKMLHEEAPDSAAHAPVFAPASSMHAVPTTPHPNIHVKTIRMKEQYTAPFMLYDSQARRIVANPQYDRALVTELHRVQSILLTKLRTPMQMQLSYTPKELLYELEAALYHVCASVAVQDDSSSLRYLLNDSEADAFIPQLESFLAHHNAPAKAVVALAHCLSEGSSHDLLTSFLRMLEKRVHQELDPAVHRKRTEHERCALIATKNNLEDIAQLVRDAQTAYLSIETASQAQRRQPQSDPTEVDVPRSRAGNTVPARIVEEAFYKVLRWVVAVDADRRALRAAATSAAAMTEAKSSPATAQIPETDSTSSATALKPFARVMEYDPYTGHLTLERADTTQRWGLLLNDKGLLVGVENDLRHSSEAGQRLYDAVQQQSGQAGGLAIFEVSRRRIRSAHLSSEEVASSCQDIMQRLRASLTQPVKTLSLTIERRTQTDLTVPREVLFEVSYQGGEGGVGQRCLLMMERASTSISWGLKLQYVKGSAAVLSDFAPNIQLSNDAKNLLFDMRGRLRVVKVNNQDMAKLSVGEMKSLISGSLLLTLHLQVTDAKGDVPPEAEATPPSHVEQCLSTTDVGGALETPAVDAVFSEEQKEAAALAEAESAADDPAESSKMVDSLQGEIDDLAASIADQFLKQQSPNEELEANPSAKGDEAAMEVAGGEAFELLEDLHAARHTTTLGSPGDADEDSGDRIAEKDANFEQLSQPQHWGGDEAIKDAAAHFADEEVTDAVLMEGFENAADGQDPPKVEETPEWVADGKEKAAENMMDAEARAVEQEVKERIDAGEDEAEAKPSKKMHGRKKTSAKVEKTRGKRGKQTTRSGARKTRGGKSVMDADHEAEENEDAPAREAAEADGEALERFRGEEAAEVPRGNSADMEEEVEALPFKAATGNEALEGVEEMEKHGGRSKALGTATETSKKGEGEVGAEENSAAVAPDDLITGATSAPADVPLVDLPPTTAEVSMKHGREISKKQRKASEEADATETALGAAKGVDDGPRISLAQLLDADPLTFENAVRLEKFDGSTLELERSSTDRPWNIKVAFSGDDILMTKLPPFTPKQLNHPFLRSLGAGPQGEVKWVVDGLNGQDLSVMTKSSKTKALDAIKGSTRLSFVLRALRR